MENFPAAPANEIPLLETEENDCAVAMDKMRLSSLIKLSTTKSRNLVNKKQLPHAHHPRFNNRKPWRVSLPRLEKRVLVRATLDKALRVLSRHQSQLLNAGEEAASTATTPETTFDDVDVGAWKLVKNGSHTLFQEEIAEEIKDNGVISRKRDRESVKDNNDNKENNDTSNKRFKADRNNNGTEESTKGQYYESAYNNAVGNENKKDDEDDEDVIIDIESEGEPEEKTTETTMNWQLLPTSNQTSFLPPPPPPISPPLPPHLLQPQPQPGAAFDYDYYFYCVRFFYHYQRFCAARDLRGSSNNASLIVS